MRHDRIIDLFGGNVALGKLLGVSDSAISRWRGNGIPPQHWLAVVALSRKHATEEVTVEMIAVGPPRPRVRKPTKGRAAESVA